MAFQGFSKSFGHTTNGSQGDYKVEMQVLTNKSHISSDMGVCRNMEYTFFVRNFL